MKIHVFMPCTGGFRCGNLPPGGNLPGSELRRIYMCFWPEAIFCPKNYLQKADNYLHQEVILRMAVIIRQEVGGKFENCASDIFWNFSARANYLQKVDNYRLQEVILRLAVIIRQKVILRVQNSGEKITASEPPPVKQLDP